MATSWKRSGNRRRVRLNACTPPAPQCRDSSQSRFAADAATGGLATSRRLLSEWCAAHVSRPSQRRRCRCRSVRAAEGFADSLGSVRERGARRKLEDVAILLRQLVRAGEELRCQFTGSAIEAIFLEQIQKSVAQRRRSLLRTHPPCSVSPSEPRRPRRKSS